MNLVTFYRPRNDGNVDVARVKVSQPSLDTLMGVKKYGNARPQKRQLPTVREIEDHMLRQGWTRERLKPGAIRKQGIVAAVRRALAA